MKVIATEVTNREAYLVNGSLTMWKMKPQRLVEGVRKILRPLIKS